MNGVTFKSFGKIRNMEFGLVTAVLDSSTVETFAMRDVTGHIYLFEENPSYEMPMIPRQIYRVINADGSVSYYEDVKDIPHGAEHQIYFHPKEIAGEDF